jgi:hypothetical protein
MSDNRSWKTSFQSNAETAIEVVRQCVSVLRSRGLKTDSALRDLAPELGVTHRRIRTLFHRDGIPVVLKNEWMQLRYRAGLFFLNEASRLRELADDHEERGNNLVSGQLEFSWNEQNASPSRRLCA